MHRRLRDRWTVLSALLLFGLLPGAAHGQSTLGTIRGNLTDARGRVVARAAVRIVDEGTGVTRAVQTDSRGDFEAPHLRAGAYRVEDASPGFSAFRRDGLVLRAGETLRVDLSLTPAVEEFVVAVQGVPAAAGSAKVAEVVVRAPGQGVLQLESATVQGGLEAQQLRDLPRGRRDFQDFLYLSPNVVGSPEGQRFLGARSYGVSYVHDGQPSSGSLYGTLSEASPGLEAIDEIKVLSNSHSAEFGGVAAVVVTTRRGGNRFSGSAFYDHADDATARYEEDERDFRSQRFGGALGGPLRRDKTFFFLNYEGAHNDEQREGVVNVVPTEGMRQGDFSGTSITVVDPLTGLPFPGNVIPSERIDPAARRILDFFYPLPNLPSLPSGLGQQSDPADVSETFHRWDLRLDHELTGNDSLFLRASAQRRVWKRYLEDGDLPHLGFKKNELRVFTVASSWSRVVSSSLLNELRAGYNSESDDDHSHYRVGAVADELGIEVPAAARERRGYPAFSFLGSDSVDEVFDNAAEYADRDVRQSSFSISDTVTWLRGKHSTRAGFFYSRDWVSDALASGVAAGAGQLVFTDQNTGNSFGDFLLGLPAESIEGVNGRGLQPLQAASNTFAGFVQDDWRVDGRLTVFAGLRYEIIQPFPERRDLLVQFDPQTDRIVVPSDRTVAALSPAAARYPRATAAELGLGRSLARTDRNNFAPRLGFLYGIGRDNRTVLRAGFGLFYPKTPPLGITDSGWGTEATRGEFIQAPFSSQIVRLDPQLSRGFSTGTLVSDDSVFAPGASVLGLVSPRIAQYHVTLERELPWGVGVRASYLGARSDKLLVTRYVNTMQASATPFDPNDPADRQRLPFPDLPTSVRVAENTGTGRFDALQLEVRRRYRGGLGFTLAYTLAGSSSTAPDGEAASLGIPQYDPYDLASNRGPDPYSVRHRFVMDAVWDVPVGRNRKYLSRLPWAVDAVLGGWTVSALVQARSGPFLDPCYYGVDVDGVNPANTGPDFGCWRPNVSGDTAGPGRTDAFYNLGALSLPAYGTLSRAGSGVIEGPGMSVVNLGFYKELARRGPLRVQLRLTLENVLDRRPYFEAAESDFLDVTDYVVGGRPATEGNGYTNVLQSVTSLEGFPPRRVVRFGVRVDF
ncbi:MAG: TonB-dependent receptor [Vicinamibacteria bacterium]